MADDLLAAVLLATRAPILLAPAMNVNMWEHPLTRENLARLLRTGRVTTVGPDRGELACGWIGAGRLIEPAEIVAAAVQALARPGAAGVLVAPLAGHAVVVTAGPTYEPIDDVRFLGNRSSGKMGFALAAEAAALGADVTLIAGPVALPTPEGAIRRIDVESAAQLREALAFTSADVVVMAAAVADFRPAARARGKLSRRAPASAGTQGMPEGPPSLDLVANPDLLAELGRRQPRPTLIGFAAEHAVSPAELVVRARCKLREKGCDAIVANDVSVAGLGFGSDRNAVTVVTAERELALGPTTKRELAAQIWAELVPLLPKRAANAAGPTRAAGGR
jgi:phosphopantothenoylcysteine decarboxylase/phosphopantothenate--cysteine ligase